MDNNYLMHWRTKGSKNGVRLYQNKDGSLTPLGREHYGVGPPRSAGEKLSKWVSKKKEAYAEKKASKREERIAKLEAKREAKNPYGKLKDMDDVELKKAIDRMKLENDYRSEYAKSHPQKKSFGKELASIGKEILKDSLKDAFKQNATTFIKNALGINSDAAKATATKKAYQEWKDHGFDPDYAPTSVKNKYSEAYVQELNRSAKVKAQQADHSFNAVQGDTNYWKNKQAKADVDAAKPVLSKKHEWEAAKSAAQKAQEAYDKAQNATTTQRGIDQIKSDLDRANVAAETARREYETARADLTEDQRKLLK